MSNQADYGNMTKRIVFTDNDHRHAQLVLKLKYLRLSQAAFFRHIITGLIEDDPRIVEYTNDVSFKSKNKREKTAKLQKIGDQKLRDFQLSEEDVEDIFDLIEGERPKL